MQKLTCPQCGRETVMLYHVQGRPGEYCAACKPDNTNRWPSLFDETVNGTVIGPITTRFEFWTRDNKEFISAIDEGDEETAKEWFKAWYPAEYKQGVRMRIFGG